MHTVFINTSKNELDEYTDILDVPRETRRLITHHFPLSEWKAESKDYEKYAVQIGEMIDSYKDINNEFNLIIYVDLLEFKAYADASMSKTETEAPEKIKTIEAIHLLLKQYFSNTICAALDDCGRKPQQVLVVFEENVNAKDRGKFCASTVSEEKVLHPCLDILTLPSSRVEQQELLFKWFIILCCRGHRLEISI